MNVCEDIRLIGPGGAGKSTIGAALAAHLEVPSSTSIDILFAGRRHQRVHRPARIRRIRSRERRTYSLLVATETYRRVVVLSSGFMTYAADIHLEYRRGRREIEQHPNTFVLLPSFNREVCVAETVRRQIARPFGRSPAREEAVIRKRFEIYMAVPARKIETMRPVPAVVEALVAALGVSHPVDQLDRLSATIG